MRAQLQLLFGANVRHQRKARGWTLERLAAEVGVSRETIGKIERGKAAPLFETAETIATVLGVPAPVLFGATTSMTGDGPLGHYLHQIYGSKWYSDDIELESGCGVVPIEYKQKSLIHAWQWAIGLEWYLLAADPWRLALSTDHPNGGSFLAYPEIIRLLMDRAYRREILSRVHRVVRETTLLRHDIYVADECFLTGTAAEVVPVTSLDGRPIGDGKPGSVTRDLLERFRKLTRS